MRRSRPTYQRTVYVPNGTPFPWIRWNLVAGVAGLAILVLILVVTRPDHSGTHQQVAARSPVAESTHAPTTPTATPPEPSPSPTPSPSPEPSPPRVDLGKAYEVLSVTDGDTIRVLYQGASEPVRFIGIDTPETRNPNTPVECFGPEASAFTTKLLAGGSVFLVRDGGQDDRDQYGRLLRFVYTSEGTNVNALIVRKGFGTFENQYPVREPYREELSRAAVAAERDGLGLWGACTTG